MDPDVKDQVELLKTTLRKAMGHLSRIEQFLKLEEIERRGSYSPTTSSSA